MNTWFELDSSDDIESITNIDNPKYSPIPFNHSIKKNIIEILDKDVRCTCGCDVDSLHQTYHNNSNRLHITNSNTRVSLNKKKWSGDKWEWGYIKEDKMSNTFTGLTVGTNSIFQINIFQCDDGWFKVEVLNKGLWGKYRTYICDQEFGVIDFLKSIKII